MEVRRPLCVEPELGRRPQCRSELQRHLGRHRAASIDDAGDALDVAAEMIGELPLCEPERDEKRLTGISPGDVGVRRRTDFFMLSSQW